MRIEFNDLAKLRQYHSSKRIAYGSGCFDLLHTGHLEFLQRLSALGELCVVGVTPDEKITRSKGPGRPIIPEENRARLVDALDVVDYTLITPATSPTYRFAGQAVVAELQPDIFLVPESETGWENDRQWLEQLGVDMVIDHSYNRTTSTTDIINRIAGGNRPS